MLATTAPIVFFSVARTSYGDSPLAPEAPSESAYYAAAQAAEPVVFDAHSVEARAPGLSLLVAASQSEATLLDAEGEVAHRWSSQVGQPEPSLAERLPTSYRGWSRAALGTNGELYAVVPKRGVIKLDAASRLLWQATLPAHRELSVASDGSVVVLTEPLREVRIDGRDRTVLDPSIAILDARSGAVTHTVSLSRVLERADDTRALAASWLTQSFRASATGVTVPPDVTGNDGASQGGGTTIYQPVEKRSTSLGSLQCNKGKKGKLASATPDDPQTTAAEDVSEGSAALSRVPGFPADALRVTTVAPLLAHPAGLWREGDVLVSFAHLGRVAVVDPYQERIVWSAPAALALDEPQHVAALPNGHLLILEAGRRSGQPRVRELDPESSAIVWSSETLGAPLGTLRAGGAVAPLSNGNLLLTDRAGGRAFELTRQGAVVWEQGTPLVHGATSGQDPQRAAMVTAIRYDGAPIARFLK